MYKTGKPWSIKVKCFLHLFFKYSMMKYLALVFFSLFFAIPLLAQYEDTWQPPALYKQNGVKARIIMFDRARFKERAAVDFFDHNGYVTEHIEYDSTGRNYIFRETFLYDSAYKIINQMVFKYGYFDTAQKKFIKYTTPDTIRISNQYDSLKRLVKQIGKDTTGKVVLDIAYTFNPFIKTRKKFRNDSLISETTSYYDVPSIENKFTKKYYGKDDEGISDYTYLFKNHFDKAGKITRRKVSYEGADEKKIFYKEIDYEYMLSGLMIKKLLTDRSDGEYWMVGFLFDYKFW